ncbi:MAG: hypothetical protein ACREHD_20050, partial [Pirellulales bacterium]
MCPPNSCSTSLSGARFRGRSPSPLRGYAPAVPLPGRRRGRTHEHHHRLRGDHGADEQLVVARNLAKVVAFYFALL